MTTRKRWLLVMVLAAAQVALALVVLLGLAGPAGAQEVGEWTTTPSGSSSCRHIEAGDRCFYRRTGALFVDTDLLKIQAPTGTTLTFDPNLATEGTDSGTVYLRHCPDPKTKTAAACPKILVDVNGGGVDDLPLNGDDGTTTAQRTRIWDIPSGIEVYLDVETACGAGDVCQAVLEGKQEG